MSACIKFENLYKIISYYNSQHFFRACFVSVYQPAMDSRPKIKRRSKRSYQENSSALEQCTSPCGVWSFWNGENIHFESSCSTHRLGLQQPCTHLHPLQQRCRHTCRTSGRIPQKTARNGGLQTFKDLHTLAQTTDCV